MPSSQLNMDRIPKNLQDKIRLQAPLWNNKFEDLQYQTNPRSQKRNPLSKSTCSRLREWIAHAHKIYCLEDVLVDQKWPTLSQFTSKMNESRTPDTPANLSSSNINFLYKQLKQIYDKNFPDQQQEHSQLPDQVLPLPWGISTSQRVHRFPTIGAKILYKSSLPKKKKDYQHPLRHPTISAPDLISELAEQLKEMQPYVLPRQGDIVFRTWWRILPVGYLFHHFDPGPQRYCPFGCTAIETYEHLFFNCAVSSIVWSKHNEAWIRILSQPPTWTQVLYAIELPIKRDLEQHSQAILLLWRLLRCSIFHLLWAHRNNVKHNNQPAPVAEAVFQRTTHTLKRYTAYANNRETMEDPALADQLHVTSNLLFPLQ